VDSNGRVNVGIASGNNVFGTFTGVVSGDSASGIWQDKFQCYGTWTATKQAEPSKKQGDSDIEAKLINLKQLLEKGLISQEDYDRQKAKLLDQL
jgi:membrane protease subunit (stomatin/prohibitin family)